MKIYPDGEKFNEYEGLENHVALLKEPTSYFYNSGKQKLILTLSTYLASVGEYVSLTICKKYVQSKAICLFT